MNGLLFLGIFLTGLGCILCYYGIKYLYYTYKLRNHIYEQAAKKIYEAQQQRTYELLAEHKERLEKLRQNFKDIEQ
jgi:hypothetical protein